MATAARRWSMWRSNSSAKDALSASTDCRTGAGGGGGGGGGEGAAVKDGVFMYDVINDPTDMHDVAASKPSAVASMKEMLPPGWCR